MTEPGTIVYLVLLDTLESSNEFIEIFASKYAAVKYAAVKNRVSEHTVATYFVKETKIKFDV